MRRSGVRRRAANRAIHGQDGSKGRRSWILNKDNRHDQAWGSRLLGSLESRKKESQGSSFSRGRVGYSGSDFLSKEGYERWGATFGASSGGRDTGAIQMHSSTEAQNE